MNIQEIKELIQLVSASGLSKFELEQQGTSIRMEAASESSSLVQAVPAAPVVQERVQTAVAQAPAVQVEKVAVQGTEVKAPLVGVFYESPAPGQDAFVSVGSTVKKGDVLCIVEAMKVMNEITAETDGVIQSVEVENEQLVEYGQTLFVIG